MRSQLIAAISLTLCAGAMSCAQSPASTAIDAAQKPDAVSAFPDDAAILALIKSRVDEGRAVGIVLGVLDADGATRIVSYGNAGPGAQPLGPDSVFKIGSVTKVFTATLLGDMVSRGEAKLDDPAQMYAPAGLVLPQRNGKQITLAHLAEQMSGLPREAPNRPVNAAGPSYAALTKDMLYDLLKSYQLPRDPGDTFEYSNLGSGLLGYILSRHEGMDYDTLVHRRVLDQLKMARSGVGLTADMQKAMAVGHGPDGLVVDKKLEENWSMPRLEGAGDLHSTASDLLKFVAANLGPPDTPLKRAMQEAQKPRVPRPQGGMLGLEWNRYSMNDGPEIVFHSGAVPGYGSWLGFDPKRRIGVVLLQNTAFAATDIAYHLLDPAAPLAPAAERRTEISLPVEQLAKYVGLYAWDGLPNADKFLVTLENGHLTTQPGLRPKEAVFPESSTMFFFRSSDARIIFTTNDAGVTTGLLLRRGGKDEVARKVQ